MGGDYPPQLMFQTSNPLDFLRALPLPGRFSAKPFFLCVRHVTFCDPRVAVCCHWSTQSGLRYRRDSLRKSPPRVITGGVLPPMGLYQMRRILEVNTGTTRPPDILLDICTSLPCPAVASFLRPSCYFVSLLPRCVTIFMYVVFASASTMQTIQLILTLVRISLPGIHLL